VHNDIRYFYTLCIKCYFVINLQNYLGATGVVQQVSDQMHIQRSTFLQRPTSQPVQNWTQPQQLPNQSPVRQQFTDQC